MHFFNRQTRIGPNTEVDIQCKIQRMARLALSSMSVVPNHWDAYRCRDLKDIKTDVEIAMKRVRLAAKGVQYFQLILSDFTSCHSIKCN